MVKFRSSVMFVLCTNISVYFSRRLTKHNLVARIKHICSQLLSHPQSKTAQTPV